MLKENFYNIDDALIIKYLLNEANPDEQAAIEDWIALEINNRKHFEDLKIIWEQSKTFAGASLLNEDAAWQKFKNRIHNVPFKSTQLIAIQSSRWLKIAAIFLFIAGAAIFSYIIFNKREIKTLAVNSLDKVITDTLPDKSVITLNKNSTIDYPEKFSGNTRIVALKGEAFFSITPDNAKPFIIHTNDITIKVVGTSFNVKSINGNTEVIVETGIVEVIRNDKKIDLRPHESILVKKDDGALSKEVEKGTLYNYYRTKEFECDNTPLWQLAQVLSQAYNVDIIIASNELRNMPITATFNNESLDSILEIVRQTFNISVTKTTNKIILK